MNISERIERMRQRVIDQRRAAFAALQAASPEIKREMQAMKDKFGKPEAVRVEIQGKVIYERGELLPVKFDKYMRSR
jgi:hypothetical protein